PEGARSGIGALLTGVHEGGQLVYAGKVGTGFSARMLQDLKKRLEPLEQPTSPFSARLTGLGRPHWVRPELVAEVAFGEWTADGRMRHPSFQGLREDKPAGQVVRERPARAAAADSASAEPRVPERPSRTKPPSRGRASAAAVVAGVRLTHPERVLYPPRGVTKLDLARFYESIADWILPHLRDRPT